MAQDRRFGRKTGSSSRYISDKLGPDWIRDTENKVYINLLTQQPPLAYQQYIEWSKTNQLGFEVATIDDIRNDRDVLLAKTDWTQLSDVPKPTRDKYKEYRKALRSITDDIKEGLITPDQVVWPISPEDMDSNQSDTESLTNIEEEQSSSSST